MEALWSELLQVQLHIRCVLVGETSAIAPPPTTVRSEGDDEALLSAARNLGAVVRKTELKTFF